MDAWFLAILLLLLSMVLLFCEVLIPSGGLLFFGSMVALGCAVWSAWSAWWYPSPVLFWTFVMGALVLMPSSVMAAIQVWPHTPMGKKLEPPTTEEVTPYVAEQQRLAQLVGMEGQTVTPLNPAGLVLVQGERIHCFSEGMIVERGTTVRVLAVQGNRILVRQVLPHVTTVQKPDSSHVSNTPSNLATRDLLDDGTLDFDLPSSKS